MKKMYTEGLTRSWLENRISAYRPRLKKVRTTKVAPYAFTLKELYIDLKRTLDEFESRILKGVHEGSI